MYPIIAVRGWSLIEQAIANCYHSKHAFTHDFIIIGSIYLSSKISGHRGVIQALTLDEADPSWLRKAQANLSLIQSC
jgi:hypothetical protein